MELSMLKCTKVSCRMSCCLMLAKTCHCNVQFSKTTTPSTLLDAQSRFFKTRALMFLIGQRNHLMRPLSRICGRLPTTVLTDRKPRVLTNYGSKSKKPGTHHRWGMLTLDRLDGRQMQSCFQEPWLPNEILMFPKVQEAHFVRLP